MSEAQLLAAALPAGIAVVETFGTPPPARLWPEEEAALGSVSAGRRSDHTAARWCARRALEQLGVSPAPILTGVRGEPLLPAGVAGSLTHCRGYRAAAMARRDLFAAIGIDAEPDQPLPPAVLRRIALPAERRWLAGHRGALCWDRILFSAKESVYKAWFPLTGRPLRFADAQVTFHSDGLFTARLLVTGPLVGGRRIGAFTGFFRVRSAYVGTAVVVPACSAENAR